jgi:pimeloyl-ACP methyl ester carboxylesterase
MSVAHTVVLLPALGEDKAQSAALRAVFEEATQVLMPDISVRGTSPVILEEPALAVLDALTSARTAQVILIGHGWGAMVALQVAAKHADRVAALILSTNARPRRLPFVHFSTASSASCRPPSSSSSAGDLLMSPGC